MTGTGAVTIGGATVYTHFAVDGRRVRLRVSADERDRLDLHPGRPFKLVLPGMAGAPPVRALVTAVRADPPFAWVEAEAIRAAAGPAAHSCRATA